MVHYPVVVYCGALLRKGLSPFNGWIPVERRKWEKALIVILTIFLVFDFITRYRDYMELKEKEEEEKVNPFSFFLFYG
ncbi:hypothetical protein D6D85_05045 [Candidatus Methanodesulfokora washburnensis]|uniref:Uncharacterized protein n=1 Tax=Candidatus Methanodesulfokora washburnensis TaxID=2478471 RepID=A0A3R9PKL5_9CREN|nr:hypothetical protein D6D85_05045 [Candidatus Methanodesulfokores washburnensis]